MGCRAKKKKQQTLILLHVQYAPTVLYIEKDWPGDGLEKTETCSHTRVLMLVCYCCVWTE